MKESKCIIDEHDSQSAEAILRSIHYVQATVLCPVLAVDFIHRLRQGNYRFGVDKEEQGPLRRQIQSFTDYALEVDQRQVLGHYISFACQVNQISFVGRSLQNDL